MNPFCNNTATHNFIEFYSVHFARAPTTVLSLDFSSCSGFSSPFLECVGDASRVEVISTFPDCESKKLEPGVVVVPAEARDRLTRWEILDAGSDPDNSSLSLKYPFDIETPSFLLQKDIASAS